MTKAPAKTPAKVENISPQVALYRSFEAELEAKASDLAALLPDGVTLAKLMKTALIAVKNEPMLLQCDRRSLHKAVTQSAEDGIYPDGREGAITYYKTKQKDGSFVTLAQWMPMVKGIRRRARELGGIIIDAQLVYANDHFVWMQGDDARIEHKPAMPLGADRGQLVGAFAIFRHPTEGVIHREVMSIKEIEKVRAISRSKDGPMWRDHYGEACRKTVARRGMKSVPVSPALEAIVSREDQHVDLDLKANPSPALVAGADIPSPSTTTTKGKSHERATAEDLEPVDEATQGEAEAAPEAGTDRPSDDKGGSTPLHDFRAALALTRTSSAANKVWSRFEKLLGEADMEAASEAFNTHVNKLGEQSHEPPPRGGDRHPRVRT